MPTYHLLSHDNGKFQKSNGTSMYMIAGLSLSPASRSGYNVCGHSTDTCRLFCVADAGGGRWQSAIDARIRKTQMFFQQQDRFADRLSEDIETFIEHCAQNGTVPACRLNTFSDLPWERIKMRMALGHGTVIDLYSDRVTFYDYTKYPYFARASTDKYHLTYSASGNNTEACQRALSEGYTAAVVFDTKRKAPLPQSYWGHDVIDGDVDDLRFLDSPGTIVGLRAKHALRTHMDTPFVFSATEHVTEEVAA